MNEGRSSVAHIMMAKLSLLCAESRDGLGPALSPEQQESCATLGAQVLSGLGRHYPEALKDCPDAAIFLRTHAAYKAELLLRATLGAKPKEPVPPYTPSLRFALEDAREMAGALGLNYVGSDHLLLALIKRREGDVYDLLVRAGISPPVLEAALLAAHRARQAATANGA